MWGTLRDPKHVEFYKEFQAGRQSENEDWMPMVRAVEHLQSLADAPRLYAFTSLWRFHLTTAQSYQECGRHWSVSVIWRFTDQRFYIAFGRLADGWVEDRPPERICAESDFRQVVEPFIQRLLESRPDEE
jgi:hypothetical protein